MPRGLRLLAFGNVLGDAAQAGDGAAGVEHRLAARQHPPVAAVGAHGLQLQFVRHAGAHGVVQPGAEPRPAFGREDAPMFGIWKGRQRGVVAHHAVQFVGPRDLSGFHVHGPTAEAGHALRLFQLHFAGAQGFFRLLAPGDVAGNGGAARDMAFRVPDWEH